jgi:hypothetical protein
MIKELKKGNLYKYIGNYKNLCSGINWQNSLCYEFDEVNEQQFTYNPSEQITHKCSCQHKKRRLFINSWY